MAHGYPGEADTAAYLVHNPQDIGETLKTKEGQKEPDPVISLMSLRTSRTNLVSGLPTPVTEGALDVSTTVASILDNNVFSVLGDIGVSDLWNFIRGMRYGPGKRQVFGYNPIYDSLMGDTNNAFNTAMAAIEKKVSDERLKKGEKKDDDDKEIKDALKASYRQDAVDGIRGVKEGMRVGASYRRAVDSGTFTRAQALQMIRDRYDSQSPAYQGGVEYVAKLYMGPFGNDAGAISKLVKRRGKMVLKESLDEIKGLSS